MVKQKRIKIHFLGIGGSGISAIAAIAQAQGFEISGCDKNPNTEYTKHLTDSSLLTGHSPKHLKGVDILTVTPAIFSSDPDNEELKTARGLEIPVMTWQEFMGKYLEKDKFVIAICGTHGKSTTTAMVGLMLEAAGLDPTVELGANVPQWDNRNFRVGQSKYFVTEADEFNDSFLVTHPDIAIVHSIEFDHPEYFTDFEDYKKSFIEFLGRAKTIIANTNNPGISEVISNLGGLIKVISFNNKLIDFELQIPGSFNRMNASAVYQLGLQLGIDPEIIKQSLQSFTGIGRRLELLGDYQGIKVYSDYGHHPTEIKVTVQALKDQYPDSKIWLIYQPHMFSRTKALWDDFVKVLTEVPVDKVFVLDIFKSREEAIPGISSQRLVKEINSPKVEHISPDEKILEVIKQNPDINNVMFMGAGSIHELAKQLP